MSNKSGTSEQVISLPRGGGAMHGIGEKFSPDLHTGTGNFTVPIALPPGRNGFQPQLNLVYSTGNGNGPFGLGWGLSIPGVSRKTSRGIPRYHDYNSKKDPDVFILSGAEDLVPVGNPDPKTANSIMYYRPRTDGLFALIEHHHDDQDDYWKVRSKDGLISVYGTPGTRGRDDVAAIAKDGARKFAWKLSETRNPFGSPIVYTYDSDEGQTGPHHWKQPRLQHIEYAERVNAGAAPFLVSVSFQYEDRPDPFSDYRAGFEIRTSTRCTSILIETHFEKTLKVRKYEFTYDNSGANSLSLLTRIDVVGFDDDGTRVQELPPLTFGYTIFDPINARKRDLIAITGETLPPGNLGRPEYELADLTGDGLPDVLEMNGTVRYWRNLGAGRFDRPRTMRNAPPFQLADSGVQMLDANGDGRIDLMVTAQPLAGYYTLNHDGEWDQRQSFRRYDQAPTFNLEDPEVKLLDLDGDGVTDALRSSTRLECYFHDPIEGWNKTKPVTRKGLTEFPDVNFSDPRVKLGDMSGDGLQDIVLIHNNRIDYWPNLGYGNWGKRITMTNCPKFEDAMYSLGYDPKRVLVGDVDGDGLADLIYVGNTKVTLWINRSGNGWSEPIEIRGTPTVTDMDAVRLVDLLGCGISGVLWSADANGTGRPYMHFLDLTGGIKPYVLTEMDNHLGATTKVEYQPSTYYYLQDRQDPKTRWKTSLPFPVQVVARVHVIDAFSGGKLTTVYRYHHGYWDGAEREFRGFGMVEQIDTETFDQYHEQGMHGNVKFDSVAEKHFAKPTLTRTWFHQGPVEDDSAEWHEVDRRDEYWQGDPELLEHTAGVKAYLDSLQHSDRQFTRQMRRDALRTLRGTILRTELYALDRFDNQDRIDRMIDRPYTVTESKYDLIEIDAPPAEKSGRKRIFFPHQIAQRTTQWERGDDPMTSFVFTRYRYWADVFNKDEPDRFDEFGRPHRQITVAMPRRSKKRLPVTAAVVGSVPANDTHILATQTGTRYARPDQGLYLHDRVNSVFTIELRSPPEVPEQVDGGHDVSDDVVKVLAAQYCAALTVGQHFDDWEIAKQTQNYGEVYHSVRLISSTASAYDDHFPPTKGVPSEVGPYGALRLSITFVFSAETLDAVYSDRRPAYLGGPARLPDGTPDGFGSDLGYFREGGGGYGTTTQRHYDFQETDPATPKLGVVTAMRDERGHTTKIQPDQYWMLPAIVTDAAGLTVSAEYNYRVMQPAKVTDPNGNSTYFKYDANGLLIKQWIVSRDGKGGTEDKPEATFEYDFLAYEKTGSPIVVRSSQRLWHASDHVSDEVIKACEFSDGFGRSLQKRAQAEDLVFGAAGDDVGLPAEAGSKPRDATGQRVTDRVVVSGWQIYDNKGRVVEKYEPFFSTGWDYESDPGHGEHAELYYDPRGQVIRTVNPDGSEQRVIYGIPRDLSRPDDFEPTPWETYTYDGNDLAVVTTGPDGQSLSDRASATHHFTPASGVLNAQGKVIAQVARNGPSPVDDWHLTRSNYDVRGNLLEIVDALGRTAFKYAYDLLNRPLRVESIDAGVRLSVLDALGNLVEYHDSKGSIVLRRYDELNRLIGVWAIDDAQSTQTLTQRERVIYGDKAELADAKERNLLGKPYIHYDEAGKLTFDRYDFKGNLIEKARRVVSDDAIAHGWIADWGDANAETSLDAAEYRTSSQFDALNRAITITYPADVHGHRAKLTPAYNRAGALRQVALDDAPYVNEIAYNAKGQRVLIAYGNNVMTRYAYDPKTFRLARLRTERYVTPAADTWQGTGASLQDFAYTYDLVGNIVSIDERVPNCGMSQSAYDRAHTLDRDRLVREFEYDPIYRLVAANGRACISTIPRPFEDLPMCGSSPANFNQTNAPDLTEPYAETYHYDPAGNMLELAYRSGSTPNNWTRTFGLGKQAPSNWNLAPNNRLTTLEVGAVTYAYKFDDNGNLIQQNLETFHTWDHADRMIGYRVQNGGGISQQAHYLYGADGIRVKKWVQNGSGQPETTVYIDGIFEFAQWTESGNATASQNNHLHVMDNQSRVALVRVGTAHSDDKGPDVQFHLGDHLGSSQIVLGGAAVASNNFINREELFPYGETSFGSFGKKRYRFTGKERDEESELNYHGARYYAPWLGRWISCDPAGIKDGTNLYAYTRLNPANLVDRDGLQTENQSKESSNSLSQDQNESNIEVTVGEPTIKPGLPKGMTYSKAAEADEKMHIDLHLAAEGVSVKINNGEYWKRYIEEVSGGKVKVSENADGQQFYFVKGGFEGFLNRSYATSDASKARWDNRQGTTDVNDALVVFNAKGELLGVAQTAIPNYYPATAKVVANEWDGALVFRYYNSTYRDLSMSVVDAHKYRPAGNYWIDMHRDLGTLGCIEIVQVVNKYGAKMDTEKFISSLQSTKQSVTMLRTSGDKAVLTTKELNVLGRMRLIGDWNSSATKQRSETAAPPVRVAPLR